MLSALFFMSIIIVFYDTFCILSANGEALEIGRNSFLSAAAGILLAVFYATALAIVGFYSLWLLDLCLLLTGMIALLCLKNKKTLICIKRFTGYVKGYKWNVFAITIALICAFLYLAFPTKYLMGDRDQGLYIINGVNISQNGTMQLSEDKFLSENYDLIKDAVRLGYPGIYSAYNSGISENTGDLTPQFLPMFPAALAIGYDLFGIEGLVRVNCVIGLLALLSIYYFTKKVFGNITAVLSLLFMAMNPSQLWNARITQTELLCQLLFFLLASAFITAWQKNSASLSALAGALIGIGCFCRVDTYIWGLAVFAIFTYSVLFYSNKLKIVMNLAVAVSALFAISFLYGLFFSRPYYRDLWHSGSLKGLIFLNICFAAVAFAAFVFSKIASKGKPYKNFILDILNHPLGSVLFSGILLLVFGFAYYLRPWITPAGTPGYFNAHAMVEFCWYTSFIAVPLAIFGIYSMLRKDFPLREESFLFLMIGLSSMFGYIYRPSISPDHIWVSRRWITVNIPFVIILASYGIYTVYVLLKPRFGKLALAAACGCSLWIFGYTGYHSLPFLTNAMLDKIDSQYASVMRDMDSNALYLTDNGQIAGIMKYVYGLNIYLLRSDISNLSDYLLTKETDVYVISNDSDLSTSPFINIDYRSVSEFKIGGDFLTQTVGSYPQDTFDWSYDLSLYKLAVEDIKDIAQKTYVFDLLRHFGSENRQNDSELFISSGNAGFLAFGPYIQLPKGKYDLEMDIRLQNYSQDDVGFVDVAVEEGNTMIRKDLSSKELYLNGTDSINLEFDLPEKTSLVEFRLYTADGTIMRLDNISLTLISGR